MTIPLIDLTRETTRLRPELDAAIARVVASGRFILTDEDEQFERAFAAYCGTTHAVGVASGTDAITIALLACGVSQGDEVITAANTCVPTIVGIERAGAMPVLADVDAETYTLDPEQVERRLTSRTRALLPVHLYGQTADMGPLLELATDTGPRGGRGLRAGARREVGGKTCRIDRPRRSVQLLPDEEPGRPRRRRRGRDLRRHGARAGATLAELRRANPLRARPPRAEQPARRAAGSDSVGEAAPARCRKRSPTRARRTLRRRLRRHQRRPAGGRGRERPRLPPLRRPGASPRRAQSRARAGSASATGVHYPTPIHRQPAYTELDVDGGFPVAEHLSERIVSLPLSPDHTDAEIDAVANAVLAAAG